jgi:hypothetical protein
MSLLSYPNGLDQDTLLVINELPSPSDNCQYVNKLVKFDGQVVLGDTTMGPNQVFVLEK